MLVFFRIEKFELVALIDTKRKGKGEVSWCRVNSISVYLFDSERLWEVFKGSGVC